MKIIHPLASQNETVCYIFPSLLCYALQCDEELFPLFSSYVFDQAASTGCELLDIFMQMVTQSFVSFCTRLENNSVIPDCAIRLLNLIHLDLRN